MGREGVEPRREVRQRDLEAVGHVRHGDVFLEGFELEVPAQGPIRPGAEGGARSRVVHVELRDDRIGVFSRQRDRPELRIEDRGTDPDRRHDLSRRKRRTGRVRVGCPPPTVDRRVVRGPDGHADDPDDIDAAADREAGHGPPEGPIDRIVRRVREGPDVARVDVQRRLEGRIRRRLVADVPCVGVEKHRVAGVHEGDVRDDRKGEIGGHGAHGRARDRVRCGKASPVASCRGGADERHRQARDQSGS